MATDPTPATDADLEELRKACDEFDNVELTNWRLAALLDRLAAAEQRAATAELARQKGHDAGTLDLFQKYDCDWGCGCGGTHCAGGSPCLLCRVRKLTESESELARSLTGAVVARDKAEAELARRGEDEGIPSDVLAAALHWKRGGQSHDQAFEMAVYIARIDLAARNCAALPTTTGT